MSNGPVSLSCQYLNGKHQPSARGGTPGFELRAGRQLPCYTCRTMEQDLEKEEFSCFFDWKSVIGREHVWDKDATEKSVKRDCDDKSLQRGTDLAKLLRDMKAIPKFESVTLTPEELKAFKLPMNREVELITKWKEVEKCQDDLQIVRGVYAIKKKEFSQRWRKIEGGQVEMKQNMVTYNNIVKDKQGKVADGMSKRMMEKQKQQKQRTKEKEVNKSLRTYLETKDKLDASLESNKIFHEYLESVLKSSGKMFGDMEHLIGRCRALVETRKESFHHIFS